MTDQPTERTRDLTLPDDVAERIERRLPRTQFDSVDAYAAAALDVLLRQLDDGQPGDGGAPADGSNLAPADEGADCTCDPGGVTGDDAAGDREAVDDRDAVADRLESLGYL